MNEIVRQIGEIRALCQLMVEQQDGIFRLISDKLDKFEAGVISADSKHVGFDMKCSKSNPNDEDVTAVNSNEDAKGDF